MLTKELVDCDIGHRHGGQFVQWFKHKCVDWMGFLCYSPWHSSSLGIHRKCLSNYRRNCFRN
jgi:hypothetical protein